MCIRDRSYKGESSIKNASVEEMENFYEHLESHLIVNEFLDPENPRHLMRRIRRLFNKASPDQNEINILRGILSSFEYRFTKKIGLKKND